VRVCIDAVSRRIQDCVVCIYLTSHNGAEPDSSLVQQVETEVLYFAPGFARHLPRATGVAVLEYARCCIEEIEGVVGAFRTLSSQAVLLWRALCALQDKVIHVLTGETRTQEGTQAVEMLQSLSKLFRRYATKSVSVLYFFCGGQICFGQSFYVGFCKAGAPVAQGSCMRRLSC
jgi:hypothetical protein